MGTIANGEIISACFQNICLPVVLVITCNIVQINFYRQRLRLARFQFFRLCIAAQLHSCFFNAAHGIRGLCIDFHNIFARTAAGIFNSCGHRNGVTIHLHTVQTLRESRIGKAKTKREADFLTIVPIAIGAVCASGAAGIAAAQHTIFIAGFIISITHINAFCFHDVVARIGNGRNCACTICQIKILRIHFCWLSHRIDIAKLAKVLCCRCRVCTGCICISQLAGRHTVTHQHFCHGSQTSLSGAADPQTGVHTVFFQPAKAQRVGAVQQNNDFGKVFLDMGQHFAFIRLQIQIAHFRMQVITLAASAGNHYDRRIGIICVRRLYCIGIFGKRNFCHIRGRARVIRRLACVKIPQRLIQRKACFGQGRVQIHNNRRINGARTGTAIYDICTGTGEYTDACTLCQRESAIIFQQDRTFLLNIFIGFQICFVNFFTGSISTFKILCICIARICDFGRRSTQKAVYLGSIRFCRSRSRNGYACCQRCGRSSCFQESTS